MNRTLNGFNRPGGSTLPHSQVTNETMDALIMLHDVCEMIVDDYHLENERKYLERDNTTSRKIPVTEYESFMRQTGGNTYQEIVQIIYDANQDNNEGGVDVDLAQKRCTRIQELISDFTKNYYEKIVTQEGGFGIIVVPDPDTAPPDFWEKNYTWINPQKNAIRMYKEYREKFKGFPNQARIFLINTGIRKAKQMSGLTGKD